MAGENDSTFVVYYQGACGAWVTFDTTINSEEERLDVRKCRPPKPALTVWPSCCLAVWPAVYVLDTIHGLAYVKSQMGLWMCALTPRLWPAPAPSGSTPLA